MAATPEGPALLNHFTVLIYAFEHRVTGERRAAAVKAMEGRWAPWWSRLESNSQERPGKHGAAGGVSPVPVDLAQAPTPQAQTSARGDLPENEIARALDDTYFFLPYIRGLLFPETERFRDPTPDPAYGNWIAEIQQRNRDGLGAYSRPPLDGAVLRVTYRAADLARLAGFRVRQKRADASIEEEVWARLEWIDALLFPSGIGFLLLKIRLDELSACLARLIDLNYYLRLVHPPTVGWILPEITFAGQERGVTMRDLMDFLIHEMRGGEAIGGVDVCRYGAELNPPSKHRYTGTESGQVYGERCQLFAYACIASGGGDGEAMPDAVFGSALDRMLYEFATCTALGDSVTDPQSVPSVEQVAQLAQQNRFAAWRSWRAMMLRESAVFLGTEDIPFNRTTLAHNIECDYLPLYLYTLYQKLQLFHFSNALMQKGAHVEQNLREVRGLLDRFFTFRNQYWFNEITRKPMGAELYRKFQAGLGVPEFYQLVCDEVQDLQQYREERHRQRVEALVSAVTIFGAPLATVIGVFGMTFFEGSWGQFAGWTALALILSWLVWYRWTRDRPFTRADGDERKRS
jgi:hypothetical protein